jgi:hypothetical protein
MRKVVIGIIVVLVVLITTCVSGLVLLRYADPGDWYSTPDEYIDNTVIQLQGPINTIQDGYPFASDRVNEWAKYAKLRRVEVSFVGDQIKNQRGIIEYEFAADNGVDNFIADVTVTVDMKTETSPMFRAWFDVRTAQRRTIGGKLSNWSGVNEMDMAEWTLTINKAFEIIYNEIGKDAFTRFENPQITLICFSDTWTFYVTRETENNLWENKNHQICINPITTEVVEIKGFDTKEL